METGPWPHLDRRQERGVVWGGRHRFLLECLRTSENSVKRKSTFGEISVRLHTELRLRPIAPLVHHDILDVVRAGRDYLPEPLFFDGCLGMVVPHVFEGYLHQRLFVIGPQAMATVAQGGAQNRAHIAAPPFLSRQRENPTSLDEIAGCATGSTRPLLAPIFREAGFLAPI